MFVGYAGTRDGVIAEPGEKYHRRLSEHPPGLLAAG
jgi:hypothetical protein